MKFKTFFQNLSLVIVSVSLFFLIAEGATRLLWHYSPVERHEGVILVEGHRRVLHEGIEYRTNSLGLRDRELHARPRAGRTILVLGDSFVWGDGLPAESLITTKLEAKLNATGRRVEVVNGGIAGHNPQDEFHQLVRLAPVYKPSDVIVFFFTNDVLAAKEGAAGAGAARRETISWRQNLKEYLRTRSHFFAFLYYLYKDRLVSVIGVPRFLLPPDYFDLDDGKPGWREFKEYALRMRDYCGERGIDFRYVIIPTLTRLDERYPYRELHDALKGFFRDAEIRYLDLFPVFSPYRPSSLWVSLENSHWNDLGTSLAAEALSGELTRPAGPGEGRGTRPP